MTFPTYGTSYVYMKPLINAAEMESMAASKGALIDSIIVIFEAYRACIVFFLMYLEAY